MKIYLKEKLGNPDLFTGRKNELFDIMTWIEKIKREISKSTAILSRKKTGKTVFLQRLYNMTFEKNNGVIPFYYEMTEGEKWVVDFSRDFFLTFIYQYIAFKTRKPEYIAIEEKASYQYALDLAETEHQTHLIRLINAVQNAENKDSIDMMWQTARNAPLTVATSQNEYIVQFIDEFQYINKYIYWDKLKTRCAKDLAGTYIHTAEYKNAPLLVTGSWVGWLFRDLTQMLPSRFVYRPFDNLTEDETIEMIFNYSHHYKIPISNEVAFLMAKLTEGNPFYISSLFSSIYPDIDFRSEKSLLDTLEFEIRNPKGQIQGVWFEYIASAFLEMNGTFEDTTKRIMLYMCKKKGHEVSRKEIRAKLKLTMSERDLEKRLKALVECDILDKGETNFDFKCINDNIFDKVFRNAYQKEIDNFDPNEITNEYKALAEKIKQRYHKYVGEYSSLKGVFGEHMIVNHLRFRAHQNNTMFKSMLCNAPDDFQFIVYKNVWKYTASPIQKRNLQIDVFAQADDKSYSIIGEVKNRKKKFNVTEAAQFLEKAKSLMELENVSKALLIVFSISGFTKKVTDFFKQNNIAWSNDERWYDNDIIE